jgi:Cu(I)/Ag(I) efflux system membrane fusion protein
MKTKSISLLLFLATTSLILFNCGSKKESTEAHDHEAHNKDSSQHVSSTTGYAEAAEPQFAVDAAFQQQLAGVFNAYVSLKDAFISSDASKVKAESSSTQTALGKVDMKLLSGAAHNDWMNYLSGLNTSLQSIQASEDIEMQREAFSDLSDTLYKTIKAYGLGGSNAYYDFCPMAFDNQGAFWLSSDDKIRNPYFGDKMLTCGEVKEKLK